MEKYLSMAMRLGVEFVAPICVGAFIGYHLDKWLSTPPWLMIVFLFLGMAAGFLGIFKQINRIMK